MEVTPPGASPIGRLPQELLPLILQHLSAPSHLYAAGLVCSLWYRYSQEVLYSHVWARPWQKGAEVKLVRLLETLSSCGQNARLVRRLEIRSYPPPVMLTAEVSTHTLLSFLALPNLTSLAFTRDHSLSPTLLAAIASAMPNLQELEINAHSSGCFNPEALVKIRAQLRKLVLVMPDRGTMGVLKDWLCAVHKGGLEDGRRYPGLQELTILSKFSPLVSDDLLSSLSPYLPNLFALTVTACSRLTAAGVLPILRAAAYSTRPRFTPSGESVLERGLVKLGLESLERLRLEDLEEELPTLAPNLRWVAVTSPSAPPKTDRRPHIASSMSLFDTLLAPHAVHLEAVHLSRPSSTLLQPLVLPDTGFPQMQTLSLPPLADILLPSDLPEKIPRLQHLFLPLRAQGTAQLLALLPRWDQLHTLHFVVPSAGLEASGWWEPTMMDLQRAAEACRSLRQVGFRTRVYDIHRVATRSYKGDVCEEVRLERFDMEAGGRVPEVFKLGRFLG